MTSVPNVLSGFQMWLKYITNKHIVTNNEKDNQTDDIAEPMEISDDSISNENNNSNDSALVVRCQERNGQ